MAETDLMKVAIEESGPCERTISVTVEPELVRDERAKVISQLRKEARIKGFRQGKAPRELVVRMFADSIREELLQQVVGESFQKAVEQEQMIPLSRPSIEEADLSDEDRIVFKARFEIAPKVDLQQYTGFTVEKKIHKVTEQDLGEALENLREQKASYNPKPGAAEQGDYLLLDFRVLNEQGQVETERKNQLVLAGHEDPDALFSHALVGRGEGEGQTVEIDFPEGYSEEPLRGKRVTYKVDIKSVRRKELPELDERFVRQVSQAAGLDEFKGMIRENMEHDIQHQAERRVEEALFRKVIEENPFDIPSSMVNATLERQLDYYRRQQRNFDPGQLVELMRPSAEFMVRREFVVMDIARKEKLEVTDDDVAARIEQYAAQLGQPVEEVRKDFRSREAMQNLRSLIQEEKVVRFLMERNTIEEVEDEDHPSEE